MKRSRILIIAPICILVIMLTACGNSLGFGEKPLSKTVVGSWYGDFDVAKMLYKQLGDELGIELSPEPALCPITLTFEEDGYAFLMIENEDFAKAVGQCAEPFVSGFYGFDTSALIDILMQKIGMDMEGDGLEEMTYQVNDEDNTISVEYGGDTGTIRYVDKTLQFDMPEEGQTVVFERE